MRETSRSQHKSGQLPENSRAYPEISFRLGVAKGGVARVSGRWGCAHNSAQIHSLTGVVSGTINHHRFARIH